METFPSLGLPADFGPQLDALGIKTPTPIQAESTPLILEGHDLVGIAQTGTGKTLAFGLALIARMREDAGRALILAPTRELAAQIATALRPFAQAFGFRTAVLVGGVGMQGQNADLRRNPGLVVATPGRLLDHVQKGHIRLREFNKVVLDEADRMLDMGFQPAIEMILSKLPEERHTMMFSATMPDTIATLVKKFMKDPKRVEVSPPGSTVHLIDQSAVFVPQLDKYDLLHKLICATEGQALVFTRTRYGAKRVAEAMRHMALDAVEIHSDRTQNQRTAAITGFRNGKYRVMVATDIAARGIDVKDISLVVQYDLPDDHDDYVHRIGRTGRAGATGRAIIFVTPEKVRSLAALEQTVGYSIATAPESPFAREEARSRRARERSQPMDEKGRGPRPIVKREPHSTMPFYKQESRRPREDDRAPDRRERPATSNRPWERREPAAHGHRNDDRGGYERRERPAANNRPWERRDESSRGGYQGRDSRDQDRRPSYGDRNQDRRERSSGDQRPWERKSFGERDSRRESRPSTYGDRGYERRDRPVAPNRPWEGKKNESRGGYERRNDGYDRPRYEDRGGKPDSRGKRDFGSNHRKPEGPARPWGNRERSYQSRPTEEAAPRRKREDSARPEHPGKKSPVKDRPATVLSPKTGRPRPNGMPKSFKAKPKKGKKPAGFKPKHKR
ncbi:MAG: DEAD/DEAH box helicase [Chthonomonas sp.]|nr:DEAD/DEAH box helicase [Chthonomonas sp.]